MARRGGATTISELLMLVIAVAAAIVVYSFVMGFIGSSAPPAMKTQARLVVDEANIAVWVRNIGEMPVAVLFLYLKDIS